MNTHFQIPRHDFAKKRDFVHASQENVPRPLQSLHDLLWDLDRDLELLRDLKGDLRDLVPGLGPESLPDRLWFDDVSPADLQSAKALDWELLSQEGTSAMHVVCVA